MRTIIITLGLFVTSATALLFSEKEKAIAQSGQVLKYNSDWYCMYDSTCMYITPVVNNETSRTHFQAHVASYRTDFPTMHTSVATVLTT